MWFLCGGCMRWRQDRLLHPIAEFQNKVIKNYDYMWLMQNGMCLESVASIILSLKENRDTTFFCGKMLSIPIQVEWYQGQRIDDSGPSKNQHLENKLFYRHFSFHQVDLLFWETHCSKSLLFRSTSTGWFVFITKKNLCFISVLLVLRGKVLWHEYHYCVLRKIIKIGAHFISEVNEQAGVLIVDPWSSLRNRKTLFLIKH